MCGGGVLRPVPRWRRLLPVRVRVLLLTPLLPLLGWGAYTHAGINRAAYRLAVRQRAELPPEGEEYFAGAGLSPDAISVRSDLTGRHEYDYAHNLIDPERREVLDVNHDGGRTSRAVPAFGDALIAATPEDSTARARLFAYGWTAHQIADSYAHGEEGYVNATPPYPGLVRLLGSEAAAKIGPHGLNEIAVDVLEYAKRGERRPPELRVPVRPCLLYHVSRRFIRFVPGLDSQGAPPAPLTPWRAWLMTRFWQAVLNGAQVRGIGTVSTLFRWVDDPGFSDMARYYRAVYPYQQAVDRAVREIANMLTRGVRTAGGMESWDGVRRGGPQ